MRSLQESCPWLKHDGGECPVHPDTLVEVPAGTYHSPGGHVTLRFRAGDAEWNDDRIRHLRDEIRSYRVVEQEDEGAGRHARPEI